MEILRINLYKHKCITKFFFTQLKNISSKWKDI